jgi:hypothetical protein
MSDKPHSMNNACKTSCLRLDIIICLNACTNESNLVESQTREEKLLIFDISAVSEKAILFESKHRNIGYKL